MFKFLALSDCEEGEEGVFTVNLNGCVFTKKIIQTAITKKSLSFSDGNSFLKIENIQNFVSCLEQNNKCKLVFNDMDGCDSIYYENNILTFQTWFVCIFSENAFVINEENKQEVLNMFNDFLNWCKDSVGK